MTELAAMAASRLTLTKDQHANRSFHCIAITARRCSGPTTETTTASSESESAASTSAETPSSDADAPGGNARVSLTPANTHIQFVARTWDRFQILTPASAPFRTSRAPRTLRRTTRFDRGGNPDGVRLDADGQAHESLAGSGLFDVRSYPTATFESTSIATDDNGTHVIVGNLTLHGETNQIELKGTAEVNDGEVDLMVEVELDRNPVWYGPEPGQSQQGSSPDDRRGQVCRIADRGRFPLTEAHAACFCWLVLLWPWRRLWRSTSRRAVVPKAGNHRGRWRSALWSVIRWASLGYEVPDSVNCGRSCTGTGCRTAGGSRCWRRLVTRWLGNCCEWGLLVGAALVSAWLVVPLWESLWPSRVVLIPLAAVGFSLLIVGYRRGARQTSELTTMGVLGAVSILLAIAITAVFSLEFGKLAAVFTAAGGGSLAFAVWQREPAKSGVLSDLMPTAAVVLGGTAFVSYVYPQTPVYEFLLFPLTPLAWLFAHRLPWCGDRIASNLLLRAAVWGIVRWPYP